MDRFCKGLSSLSIIAALAAGGVGVTLMVWVTVSVFARYVLSRPIAYADEVANLMFLGVVFLGLSYTLFTDGHIRLGLILSRLRGRVRYGVEISWVFLGVIFATLLLWGMVDLAVGYFREGTLSYGALRAPLIYPGIVASLGALLLVLLFLTRLYRTIRSSPKQRENGS